MQIILSTEDTLRLILLGLKTETGLTPNEIFIGPVDGEIKTYASIGESVPNGVFDDDDTDPSEDTEAKPQTAEGQPAQTRKKRVRRTKEQIAADEAAAKLAESETKPQEPEVKVEVKEPVTEPAVKEAVTETVQETVAAAETVIDPFAETTQVVQQGDDLSLETEQVVTQAGQNPFGGANQDADNVVSDASLDLFSDTTAPANAGKPVAKTEGGFVTPAGDDQVLDLFN